MYYRNKFKISLFLLICGVFFSCAPKNIQPPKTQLQIREFQTRAYDARDSKQVMKAVLGALLDEGFIIKNADTDLGFISASKEADVENSTEAFLAQVFGGANARYRKSSIVEASANVTEFGPQTRVRMIFQMKILDNFALPVQTVQVEDEIYYRDFFAKVDKSLFIEKERL